MAIKPHEIAGEASTTRDRYYMDQWEAEIDATLLRIRYRKHLSECQSVKVYLKPPAEIKSIPPNMVPELLARYVDAGWDVDCGKTKCGRGWRYYAVFTAPALKLLAPVIEKQEPPKPKVARTSVDPLSGYVYLLEAENGLYKIGRSTRPNFRISQITKAVAPFAIKTVHKAWYPDCHKAEAALHKQFQHKRSRGEWFALTPADVRAVIEKAHAPL